MPDEKNQRASEQDRADLLAATLETVDQAVLITDPDGVIVEANAACCAEFGYSRRELLGRNPKLLNAGRETYGKLGYSEERYAALFSSLWNSLRDPAVGRWEGSVINRRKDGRLVWIDLRINAHYDAAGRPRNYIALPVDAAHRRHAVARSRVRLYRAMAGLVEMRDADADGHPRRVGVMARILAAASGQPEKYCEDIEIFAPMHDIGNVGVLDALLRAPRRLTGAEFERIKQHAVIGHDIVKGSPELEMAAAIILNHHERWDGAGYPNGLAGAAIPLSARITAVVDVYGALRSTRPYKAAWTHAAAVAEILEQGGRQFDPNLTDRFREIAAAFDTVYGEITD